MLGGAAGFVGSTADSPNAMPSAGELVLPYWCMVNRTSSPCDVGTLVAANTPPTLVVCCGVRLIVPDPFASFTHGDPEVLVGQLTSTPVALLPVAVRQAVFVPDGGAGLTTAPTPPVTALFANVWLNNATPAADAGSGNTTTRLATSAATSAAARTIRTRTMKLPRPRWWPHGGCRRDIDGADAGRTGRRPRVRRPPIARVESRSESSAGHMPSGRLPRPAGPPADCGTEFAYRGFARRLFPGKDWRCSLLSGQFRRGRPTAAVN